MTNKTMQRRIYALQWTRANGKFPIAKKRIRTGDRSIVGRRLSYRPIVGRKRVRKEVISPE